MIFLLIGFFITFLTLNLGGYDILPDFLGYFIIAYGLHKLEHENADFKKAKYLAVVMGALVLSVDLVGSFMPSVVTTLGLLSLGLVAMKLILIYIFVHGVFQMEIAWGGKDFKSRKLLRCWQFQVITSILVSFLPVTTTNMFMQMLLLVSLMFGAGANIAFLIYLYKCKKAYDGK